jgi:hypothetical protein
VRGIAKPVERSFLKYRTSFVVVTPRAVSGHSHQPLVQERNGVLFVNPGSAGPRRFKLPIAVGELNIAGTSVTSRIVELGGRSGA